MGVMYAIVEGPTPKLPSAYSRDLMGVLDSMLQKNPAKRSSASEVLKIPFIAKHMQASFHQKLFDKNPNLLKVSYSCMDTFVISNFIRLYNYSLSRKKWTRLDLEERLQLRELG